MLALRTFLFDIAMACNEKHCIKRHDANRNNAPFAQRYARLQIVNLEPDGKCTPCAHSSDRKRFFIDRLFPFRVEDCICPAYNGDQLTLAHRTCVLPRARCLRQCRRTHGIFGSRGISCTSTSFARNSRIYGSGNSLLICDVPIFNLVFGIFAKGFQRS